MKSARNNKALNASDSTYLERYVCLRCFLETLPWLVFICRSRSTRPYILLNGHSSHSGIGSDPDPSNLDLLISMFVGGRSSYDPSLAVS